MSENTERAALFKSGWAAGYCWANFCKYVFYGYAHWPSYSYWMVPGTVTDIERAGWL